MKIYIEIFFQKQKKLLKVNFILTNYLGFTNKKQ